MHKIIITERAASDIEKLDIKTKQRICEKLKYYAENPINYARKLINPKAGSYRFRIGEYRVIFDIEEDSIILLRVGHRSYIYK